MKMIEIATMVKEILIADYNDIAVVECCTRAKSCVINAGLVRGRFIINARLYSEHSGLVEYTSCGVTIEEAFENVLVAGLRRYYVV